MPLDAVCLSAVVAELTPQLVGSRIEKIHPPTFPITYTYNLINIFIIY